MRSDNRGGGPMKMIVTAMLMWLSRLTGAGEPDEFARRSASAAEWQSTWAFWAVIVSVGSLLVSGIALYFLFRSLQQTRSALDLTKNLGQAQARAYVEASDVGFSDEDGHIVVKFKNSGETPSPYVGMGLAVILTNEVDMNHALRLRSETPPDKTWAALGAGGSSSGKLTPRTGFSDAQTWLRKQPLPADARLLVYGTIVYSDEFGEYFKTEFSFFTHPKLPLGRFLRPHGVMPAYRPLTSDEYNRWLAMNV
ncbi:hypothetical protein [Rhizobium mayense]|uniref:hypothetical protein n=1 Tax=Rhizobium mayense TaxID=1312184 RepID=UPI00398C6773